eukprot:3705286-Pleurochrysis_carterae.AAC.2
MVMYACCRRGSVRTLQTRSLDGPQQHFGALQSSSSTTPKSTGVTRTSNGRDFGREEAQPA